MKNYTDSIFHWTLFSNALISIVITFLIIALLGVETFDFFQKISFSEFFTTTKWTPLIHPKSFGIWPLVVGTLTIVLGAMIVSLPAGILIAVFMNEYMKKWKGFFKPFLEILSGIPTVVYGYFALTFVTPVFQKIIPDLEFFNALSASLVVGLMILPMICSLCDDAFSDLPSYLKQGAYSLGAYSFEVVLFILIPATWRRIFSAFILAMSRALGETMAVTLAAGATPHMDINFLKSIQTMTAYIVQVSLGDTPQDGIEYLSCFAVGLFCLLSLYL